MTELERDLGDLSPERRALLELLLQEEQEPDPVVIRNAEEPEAPLTSIQRSMWLIEQLEPGTRAHIIPAALRLHGPLDRCILERSLRAIIQRHALLRTRFVVPSPDSDGLPIQQVQAEDIFALTLHDISTLAPADREHALQHAINEEAQQPFDLEHDSLIRARLIALSPDEHALVISVHHMVADRWSIAIILSDLFAFYAALESGTQAELPDLPLQYGDVARQEQTWLRSAAKEAQLTYWTDQLRGAPTMLRFSPSVRQETAAHTRGAIHRFHLPAELTKGVRTLSRACNATPFMILLATFKTLLARYTDQEDVVVGSVITNRRELATEQLVGPFINTLGLRTRLDGNPSFREVVARVRETSLAAFAHVELPFAYVVEALHPQRENGTWPLFNVAFALQNTPPASLRNTPLEVFPLEPSHEHAQLDLTLFFEQHDEGITGAFEYRTAVFDAPMVVRMAGHFQHILRQACADRERRLSRFTLPTGDELHQIANWSRTSSALPTRCVHTRFEHCVEQKPDAIALWYHDQHLTYDELNRRANQLAYELRRRGVGPEDIVGVAIARSPELLIALIAIFKAGGVYLPLDPALPHERRRMMIEDARPLLLITAAASMDTLHGIPTEYRESIVDIDRDSTLLAAHPTTSPMISLHPDQMAYIIYTSGSTGRPKGVMVAHLGLSNLVTAQIRGFALHTNDVVLQFASSTFDASLSEIFLALCSGATLVLAPQSAITDPDELAQLVARRSVSCLTLPPTMLHILAPERFPGIKVIIAAGEACSWDIVQRWQPGRRFFNAYGPTEATIGPSLHEVTASDGASHTVPIGAPIANMQYYILDRHMHRVPVGIPGELYIGGIGLARGYVGQPALTAQRFVPNPFVEALAGEAQQPSPSEHSYTGQRLYRTGDRARWRADGTVEFLGRIDNQVKIRGVRIEPEEVAAALQEHSQVAEAVVISQEDDQAQHRLIAYVVPRAEPQMTLWPSVAEYFVYDDVLYYAMTHDERRNARYREAIGRVVHDRVVLDIGTGKDAILARFCAEAGARRIYAVELLEASYSKARAMVESLGLQDIITVIHGDITKIDLPESVDVCVSEIVGAIGGSEGAAVIQNNARRFLKAGGHVIPERSTTMIAALQLPDDLYNNPAFDETAQHYVDQIFDDIGRPFDLRVCLKGVGPQHCISDSGVFEDLDFQTIVPLHEQHTVTLTMHRHARLDGFLVWLRLFPCLSAPIDILEHEHCWLPVYLPAMYPGLTVSAGDTIQMTIQRELCDNHLNPDYMLTGFVQRSDGSRVAFTYDAFHVKPVYRSTPFYDRLFGEREASSPRTPPTVNLESTLRTFLQQRLPDVMIPRVIVPMDALPLLHNGKIDRAKLPVLHDVAALPIDIGAPPRDELELHLTHIWEQLLHRSGVRIQDNFFELGGHSILAVQLMARIQADYACHLSIATLFAHPTIARLAEVIRKHHIQTTWSALVPIHPHGSRPPFFCVHAAGGNVLAYYELSQSLGHDQPFFAFQAPGLDGMQPCITDLAEMAATYIAAMRTVQPQGPYLLGGMSFGGFVAFEMAHQLRQQGEHVALLALIDTVAPYDIDRAIPIPVLDDEAVLAGTVHMLERLFDVRLDNAVPRSPDGSFETYVIDIRDQLCEAGVLPPATSPLIVRGLINVQHAHAEALRRYRPHRYAGSALIIRASSTLEEDYGALATQLASPTLGWEALVDGPLTVETVAGDHLTMVRTPHVKHLAQVLTQALAAAVSEG